VLELVSFFCVDSVYGEQNCYMINGSSLRMYCLPHTQSSLLLVRIFDIIYSYEADTLKIYYKTFADMHFINYCAEEIGVF
jgi:hypothetical protein